MILSQYDDPDYAINLLAEGAAGYAYLLKDRVAEGDQLARAIREVASGGSMLDPAIVTALVRPVRGDSSLSAEEDELVAMIADGKPIKAIAAARAHDPGGDGRAGRSPVGPPGRAGVRRLPERPAPAAPPPRGHRRPARSRARRSAACCPAESPSGCAASGRRVGDSERLDVTVLMSDIRGYSTIAEHADPTRLAAQLNEHRAEMNRAVLAVGGTVMQYVGDAVMAVFGAPLPAPDHAEQALRAARGHAGGPGGAEPALGRARAALRSRSASACRRGVWPPPCSARPSAWSTRWWATP